jgi:FlgD Ig-like domain
LARILSLLLVLGLLGGTAAAFAITEGLKLEKSPIGKTHIENQLFSPVCDCKKDTMAVRFQLRHGGKVTATIVDSEGSAVDTLAHHYFRRGVVNLPWNGHDERGVVVPDGTYKLRIHLAHQTITLPNAIRVKTAPPSIAIKRVTPRVFSPDRDGRSEYVSVSFTVSGTARPLLYVDGRQVGRGRLTRASGKLNWYGGAHGERYGAGVYRLALRAEDRAGNISPPTRDTSVRIRFLALRQKLIHVRRGRPFSLRVVTDAKSVQYVLHGKSGESAPGTLRLRAPKRPGTYRLFVTAVDHTEAATVVVSK